MSFMPTSQCPSHPAGSNKRQYNVCATCLSVVWDDKLHPFSEELMIILKHLLYEFDLDSCLQLVPPENGIKLCDLCLKTLQDIYFFKQKALKSFTQLKKQWEHWFKGIQTEQNAKDAIVVTTAKVEIKEEPDPLETPKSIVFSHTTPVSVDIKEESQIDNDYDLTNVESNSETESADSDDLEDAIKESSIPKTVKFGTHVKRACSGSEYRHSTATIEKANIGDKRKLIIKKNIKNKSIQNTVRPMVCIVPKPDASFRVTSDSSYMSVKIKTSSSLNVGPSALPVTTSQLSVPTSQLPVPTSQLPVPTSQLSVPTSQLPAPTSQLPVPTSQLPVATSQAQVRRDTPSKEQSVSQMASNRPCSDTNNSDYRAAMRKRKKQYTIPWYITDITREQLVKIREDLLKDPCFVKAVYKCLYCGQTFRSKENWNQHKTHCHGRSKENAEFSCFVCRLRFDTLSLLSAHMRFHSLGHHTYQCTTCDYTTKDAFFVNRHRCPKEGGDKVPPKEPSMKLATGKRQYYCPACDYVSYTVPVIPHYIRYHTNEARVKCDVCDKSMKNLATVQAHKRQYHSGKPSPEKKEVMFCAPCLKSFYSMAKYRAHMNTVKHAPKDQVKISCDECPKKFHLQELYEKHKRTHELIRSGAKPHKCIHCGLSYIFKSTLSTHIRAKHTQREIKRDHICEVCGAAFTDAGILRGHMAKHSDERPYKCEYCGDTFKYSGARFTHIKLKHKKKKTKPDDQNKGTRKSARNRKQLKEKGNEHEQSEDTHEHEERMGTHEHEKIIETHEQSMESHEQEQSMESSVYGRDMESLGDIDLLEMQNIEKSMEV